MELNKLILKKKILKVLFLNLLFMNYYSLKDILNTTKILTLNSPTIDLLY